MCVTNFVRSLLQIHNITSHITAIISKKCTPTTTTITHFRHYYKEQKGTVIYLHDSLVHTYIEKTCTIETTVKHIHDTRVRLNQEALGGWSFIVPMVMLCLSVIVFTSDAVGDWRTFRESLILPSVGSRPKNFTCWKETIKMHFQGN